MADEQIVTNIVATSDFSGLIADVQKTTASLSKLQQQLTLSNKTLASQAGQIQKAFGDTLRSTGQFTSHFVTVGSEVEKFGKNLDAGKLKLRDYFQTWQNHTKASGGLIRDLAKQQTALQNAIVQPLGKSADGLMKFNVHVANGLDATKNATALARKEMQIYNKVIQDGGVQLINWGKNTQWAGRQLTVGLTVPIAAFGAAAAKAFREADQELVRLQKVYGGLAATSTQELAKIRKDVSETAKELSAAYGTSYKETISLAADLAATGKQGNELLLATKEATRLSVLGEVDRQEAMKATLAIQSAFKQNTTQLSESINFLNAVENQTSTSLADLVEAIPKAGPVVKALGGDVQDLALYLTAMREGGVNASEGANALKSALASIINPTKVAREMFQGFGIDLGGIVTQNAGNLTGTILAIQKALDKLDPLQKSQAIEQLFGKFQFARMNALFENLGKQGSQTLQVLDLMKASSQDLANVASRELSQITESASGKYKRAVESLKAELAGLGDQFLKVGTFFIKVVDGVLKFINAMPGPIKSILGILGGITALAGPLIMLTGVFANFIGYVVKAIGHIRSLGKGGEGFRLLTPEILAAEKAGGLIEKTFYSDAKAAQVLKGALANLITEYTILQQKANAGAISAQPLISTLQGNTVMEGAQRVADPNNPLIGKPYSRQMSHLNPVAGMTTEQRASQTMFGVVPGPGPVNQRIGKNPQVYSTGDLPNVEGLTSIKGVSTGIVAQEAAKWHSMTAAIAMQSESEIKLLKKEVSATGAITTELAGSYQALLPQMTNITSMAATETKLIVAELQAGKTTVDQARAKIVALNEQVEAMIAQTARDVAASQGRNINVNAVPLTGQPVVDPVTGKTNMKEMFHKSKTSALVDKIARALGVRTSGGGYSTHTTIPKRLNSGGYVYTMNDGNIVPGPNVNADVVPAMLTPGEFVVNRESAQANLPLLEAINGGAGDSGPGYITGGQIKTLMNLPKEFLSRISLVSGARQAVERSNRAVYHRDQGALNYDQMGSRTGRNAVWNNPVLAQGRPGPDEVVGHIYNNDFYKKYGQPSSGSSPRANREDFSLLTGLNIPKSRSGYTGEYDILPNQFMTIGGAFNTNLAKGVATAEQWVASQRKPEHMLSVMELLTSQGVAPRQALLVARQVLNRIDKKISRLPQGSKLTERTFGNIVTNSTRAEMKLLAGKGELAQRQQQYQPFLPKNRPASGPLAALPKRNRGGRIGFNSGGMVPRYAVGGRVRAAATVAGLAAQFAGPQIGGMIGGSIGGDPGRNMGSNIGQGIGTAAMVASFIPMLGSFGKKAEEGAVKTGLLSRSMMGLRAAGAFLGPWGIAGTAAVAGLTAGFIAYKKHADEVAKVNRLAFAGGVKPLKSFDDQIQKVRAGIADINKRTKDLIASNTYAGIPGVSITVKAFEELQNKVKTTYPDIIKMFNNVPQNKLVDSVAGLKAQLISAGDSAQEAQAKIAALLVQTNKASSMRSVLISSQVQAVKDLDSAAKTMLNFLSKAQERGGVKDFAGSMLQTFSSLDAAMEKTAKKDGPGKALDAQFKSITNSMSKNVKLTQDQIKEISKTNPILASMLTTSDNIGDAYAKWRIALSGVNKDLTGLNSGQLQDVAKWATSVQDYFSKTADVSSKEAQGGPLGSLATSIDAFNKKQKAMQAASEAASKKATLTIKEQIALKNKQIKQIQDEASARKKALQEQQQAEDVKLQIQQEQLKYQDALATGDTSAAAQAQINIKRMVSQQQTTMATNSIDATAEAKIKKLQDEIDKLNKQGDTVSSKSTYVAKDSPASSIYAQLNALIEDIEKNRGGIANTQDKQQFDILMSQLRKIDPTQAKILNPTGTGTTHPKATVPQSAKDLNNLMGTTDSKLTSEIAKNTGTTVTKLEEIKNVLAGRKDIGTGSGTAKDPFVVGNVQAESKGRSLKSAANLDKNGDLTARGMTDVIITNKLKKGDYFTYNGKTYKVNYDGSGFKWQGAAQNDASVVNKADGGHVSGPGTGTSDSIPAYLSNGEYVIKSSAVQQYGKGFFDQINAQQFAIGGMPKYSIPGKAASVANNPFARYNNGGSHNYDIGGIQIHAAPGMDERAIARYAIQEMQRINEQAFTAKGSPGMRNK